MDWFAMAMLCAFSLATADLIVKGWLSHYSARELALVRFTVSGLLLLPIWLWQPLQWPQAEFWFWFALAAPLEILAMLLYMRAITQHPLSLTLPFMAFTPVFVIATGYLILGETVRPEGFAGILLVFAGGWLMNIRHARGSLLQAALRPLHAIWAETGSRLMLGVALIYAVTAVISKKAMEFMPPAQFGAFYYQLIGLSVLLLFSLDQPGRWRRIWRRPWPVLLVALFTAVMVTSHFLALQWVEAAYMISVKRTSMVFSILYGLIWFREAEGWTRLTAGMIMLAGVVLIANAPAMG